MIDIIAPEKVKILFHQQKAPRRKEPALLSKFRKEKTEQKSRKCHLQMHYGFFEENLHSFNIVIKKSRHVYF